MRAGCVSLKAKSDYRIRFPVRTDRLSKKIGKKRWSVGEGFKQLEKDHLIQRERRKTLIHRFATTRVTILNPHDGTPLLASPDRLDVLTANKITDFLTIPLDCLDRKSTRLNSSHMSISYAVFCLKKKKKKIH